MLPTEGRAVVAVDVVADGKHTEVSGTPHLEPPKGSTVLSDGRDTTVALD